MPVLLISGRKYEYTWAKTVDHKIWERNKVKILGVTIGNKLRSDSHVANICFKVNQRLNLLSRLATLLTFDRYILKHFLNFNLSISLSFKCFVAEEIV